MSKNIIIVFVFLSVISLFSCESTSSTSTPTVELTYSLSDSERTLLSGNPAFSSY